MEIKNNFINDLINITNQNPSLCYQCGKCSAGCPLRKYMDLAPNQVVRFVQLGKYDQALQSKTIWLCAGCMNCAARCPKNFDLHKFMDAMRELAIRNNVKPADSKVASFHSSSLKQIKKHGKLNEFGLIFDYKLNTLDLLQDVDNAPKMVMNGKISFISHNVKNKNEINKIFKKLENK